MLYLLSYITAIYFLPGIRRRTKEEKDFADFDLFDDAATPYSTFNFKYSHNAFERLSKLTEFNTLLNIEEIKTCIAQVVEKKRAEPPKCLCTLEDVPKLRRVSQKNRKRLSRFLSRIRSGRFSVNDARKGIDKSIEEEDTIVEETSKDTFTAPDLPIDRTFMRTRAISRKFVNKTLSLPADETGESAERREIPGRRKPMQPEKAQLWQDSKCNSIDEEDDSQYYTAMQSPTF